MQVDKNLLLKIAKLAKLEISEQDRTLQDFNTIIAWVEKLDALKLTDDIQPLTNMSITNNVFRNDEPGITLSKAKGLSNAPCKDTDYFSVSQVKV